jgi:hypothetical protein
MNVLVKSQSQWVNDTTKICSLSIGLNDKFFYFISEGVVQVSRLRSITVSLCKLARGGQCLLHLMGQVVAQPVIKNSK